jgi:glutathione synthase/RimK-type ligase-like ATP-grasp enzyme
MTDAGTIEGMQIKIVCSPPETLNIFTSKVAQQHALEAAGLPVAPRARSGKVILKADVGRGGKGVFKLDLGPIERSDEEIAAIAKMLGVIGPHIVQKDIS